MDQPFQTTKLPTWGANDVHRRWDKSHFGKQTNQIARVQWKVGKLTRRHFGSNLIEK